MDAKADELAAAIEEIRQRVRARHPNGPAPGGVPLVDLTPLLHARDAAEGKVASIGAVNPRPPGLVHSLAQALKKLAARALDWHVREQVEFNRGAMNCVQATIEALNESNRAFLALSARLDEVERKSGALIDETRELKDLRAHWTHWREEWERKLADTQIQFLRSLSDLQGAWQHRVTLLEQQNGERLQALHANFEASLARASEEVQKRFWVDLDRVRTEYETLIHTELRLLRQKATLVRAAAPGGVLQQLDWMTFAQKFRGTEEYVKRHLQIYAERFAGCSGVLDIGCGRGEMLEVFRSAGIPSFGLDLNDDCIAACRNKGLEVEKADLFAYLNGTADSSLGGVVCLQVVEHLPPDRLPEFVALVHAKLKPGAPFAAETPNPECLAIFAKHFFLDPTHAKPVPHGLLAFYLEEAGFGRLETIMLEPAIDSMPSLASLPGDFRRDFFGYLDYAIIGRKLG